ncbi:Platelet glycoprotein Ib beta chain [Mactra antiquata]
MAMIHSLCLLIFVFGYGTQATPSGCTLTKGLYECDYTAITTPLSAADFTSPQAQRLRITNIDNSITTSIFSSDFASIDDTLFDTNWAPTLEFKCDGTTSITLAQAAFTNMGYIRDFKIINCMDLTAAANTFEYLGELDRFVIENGTISSFDAAALAGVDITKKMVTSPEFPVKTGELVLMNSRVNGVLSQTFLSQQTNLASVTLEVLLFFKICLTLTIHLPAFDKSKIKGLGLSALDSSLFSSNTNLRFISLGYNSFSELPTGLFDGLDSLAELHLYDTQIDCTCSKLWFYSHAETTKMKIHGDVTCTSPSNWENYRAASYYYTECASEEITCAGLTLMGACITWFELAMYIVCVIAFILAGVVLGLVIHTKRQMNAAPSKGGRRKPGAKGGRRGAGGKKSTPKGVKKGWA